MGGCACADKHVSFCLCVCVIWGCKGVWVLRGVGGLGERSRVVSRLWFRLEWHAVVVPEWWWWYWSSWSRKRRRQGMDGGVYYCGGGDCLILWWIFFVKRVSCDLRFFCLFWKRRLDRLWRFCVVVCGVGRFPALGWSFANSGRLSEQGFVCELVGNSVLFHWGTTAFCTISCCAAAPLVHKHLIVFWVIRVT